MTPRAPSLRSPRAIELGLALALALAVLVLYARVVGYEFLYCDDDVYVFQNITVRRGLSWDGLRWAFLQAHAANWHPLTWLSHMLDVQLFGLAAGRHHLVNVGLHAANAVLLFALLRRATGRLGCSILVAGLFALHPLRVESVAWVAERKDVLSGSFALLTLLAYVGYARRPGWLRGLGVAALFALGLMAKSMLVTLPCVMLLLDVWPLRRWRPRDVEGASVPADAPRFAVAPATRLLLEKLPLVALVVASSIITVASQRAGGAMGDLGTLPLAARVSNAFTAYGGYLQKTLWPRDLALFYPHPALVSPETYSPWNAAAIGSALALAAITALALAQRRARPYLLVGWLWFLGMLVPVIGLVQVGDQGLADRYSYLPSIGLAIAVVWAGAQWAERARWRQWLTAGVAVGLVAACSAATWVQVGAWRNGVTLFERAVAVSPESYFAHNHLGRAYENIGEWEKARVAYQRAVDLRPSYAGPHSNLGSVLSRAGRYDEAIAHLEQALVLRPKRASFYSNLGLVYAEQGKWERAFDAYHQAIAIEPAYPTAHFNLGLALRAIGKLPEAASELALAFQLDPGKADAANELGVILAQLGKLDEAEAAYASALRVAPGHPSALCNLGLVAERRGELVRAEALYGQAVRSPSDCAWARRFFARRLLERGDVAAAIPQLERLVALRPRDADARNDLGVAYARGGLAPAAREQWRATLAIDARHIEAQSNLERSLKESPPEPSPRR